MRRRNTFYVAPYYMNMVRFGWCVVERIQWTHNEQLKVVAEYPYRSQAREAARQLNKEEPDAQKNEV